MQCFKANRDCSQASLHYQAALDRRLTTLRNDAARGARTATHRTAHHTHCLHRPAANAEAGPSSQRLSSIEWDVQLNPSGPAFELLYGGSLSPSESHNTCHVVLIWRSKLSRAKGATLAALEISHCSHRLDRFPGANFQTPLLLSFGLSNFFLFQSKYCKTF